VFRRLLSAALVATFAAACGAVALRPTTEETTCRVARPVAAAPSLQRAARPGGTADDVLPAVLASVPVLPAPAAAGVAPAVDPPFVPPPPPPTPRLPRGPPPPRS
jgi:hypothetical protein